MVSRRIGGVELDFVGTRIAINILLPGFNSSADVQLKKADLLNVQRLFNKNHLNNKAG